MTRDAPKFWDDKKQRVVEGVDIRKVPTPLADILGTYVWVYSGDPQFGGDVEDMIRRHCKDDTEFITAQSITLSAVAAVKDQPIAPKNVNGHITWGTLKVTFEGVQRVREGWSSNAAVPWMESYWEVLLTDDENTEEWLDLRGNAVGAAVVLDDNGYPFLVFDWSHPPGCHSSWSGYYVGKRLVEGKDWRLTSKERRRLGIGRTFRRVSQKEGSPDVYEEDEEEDEESDEESDCDGDSAEEDEDAGESSGEDSGSEDVGEKRKLEENDDVETGTNKRRRA